MLQRRIDLVDSPHIKASHHLQLTPGTNVAVVNAMAHVAVTEGLIDHLRSIDGVRVAAVIRDLGDRGRAARKVSLRASAGDVDVSAIARVNGGGGHKRAAGFSTDLEFEQLVEFLTAEVSAQLGS